MKKEYIWLLLWWGYSVLTLHSGQPDCRLSVSNAYIGREFWVRVVPDGDTYWKLKLSVLGLKDGTEVKFDIPALGWQLPPFRLQSGEVKILSTDQEIPLLDVHEQRGKISYTAIRIRSSAPVVVTVLGGLQAPSSYVAYPVAVWGQHYIFAGYYDAIWGSYETDWLSPPLQGFYVIGAKEGTSVQIRLRGHGRGWMRINGQDQQVAFPRDWGKIFQFTLNEGEVLDFCSLGLSQDENGNEGELDITGTEIVASEPVGVISYNAEAYMPYRHVAEVNGEPIAEMLPPKGVWGKRYITRALRRRGPLEGYGTVYSGDNYRVVALEDNTVFTVRWYDEQSGQLKGQWSGLLQRAGEFMEYVKGGNLQKFIEGYAIWEADRPFMLVQYGGVGDAAVFLWAIPVEQYLCEQVGYQWEDVTTMDRN